MMTRRFILGIGLYFFTPWGLNLLKNPLWSFLSHFRHSKYEKMTEFTFFRLVKLSVEGSFFGNEPLISQVHKKYEYELITC